MRIRLSAPDITEKEIEYVNKVLLESDGILSIGPWVNKF
jgi:dTDP-4-amino-4,6-dideoxygalactose transaminase